MKNPKFEFYLDTLNGKKIAVLGLGVSNMPLIELFSKKGAIVIGCDKRQKEAFDKKTLADPYFDCKHDRGLLQRL